MRCIGELFIPINTSEGASRSRARVTHRLCAGAKADAECTSHPDTPAPDQRWTLAGLSYDGRFFVAGVPQGLKYSILL